MSDDAATIPDRPPIMTKLPPAVVEEAAVDCIFCLCSLPYDSMPLTGECEPVAQLVPCSHFMHDHCLKPWTAIANTCPVCRASYNEVKLRAHMMGMSFRHLRVAHC